MNKIYNFTLDLFEELTFIIDDEYEIYTRIEKIRTYQEYLLKLKQEIPDEENQNRIDMLIERFYIINADLIKEYLCKEASKKIESDIKVTKNLYLINYLYEHKNYLEELENEEVDEQIKNKIYKAKTKILAALYEILNKYYSNYILDNIYHNENISKSWIDYHLNLLNKLREDCYIFIKKDIDYANVKYAILRLSDLKNKLKKK